MEFLKKVSTTRSQSGMPRNTMLAQLAGHVAPAGSGSLLAATTASPAPAARPPTMCCAVAAASSAGGGAWPAPLDFGHSWIVGGGPENAVRFWVESRTTIYDDSRGTVAVCYQCASCKSEDTFGRGVSGPAKKNLFQVRHGPVRRHPDTACMNPAVPGSWGRTPPPPQVSLHWTIDGGEVGWRRWCVYMRVLDCSCRIPTMTSCRCTSRSPRPTSPPG